MWPLINFYASDEYSSLLFLWLAQCTGTNRVQSVELVLESRLFTTGDPTTRLVDFKRLCPRLETLLLEVRDRETRFPYPELQPTATYPGGLKRFNLTVEYGGFHVLKFLNHVVDSCPNLEEFYFDGEFTEAQLQAMRTKLPRVQRFRWNASIFDLHSYA